MKLRTPLALAFTAALAFSASTALADDEPKNLKVLANTGKSFEKSMKHLTKGLGVKCKACHVKGDFASDDNKAKDAGRIFFDKAVGEKDEAKKKAALAELLKALKLDAPKKAERMWKGVSMMKKKS